MLKEFKSNVLRLSCIKEFTETRLRLRVGPFNQNRPWLPDDSTDNSVTLFLIKEENDGHQQGRLSHDMKGETNLVNYCSRPEVRHRVLRNYILQNFFFFLIIWQFLCLAVLSSLIVRHAYRKHGDKMKELQKWRAKTTSQCGVDGNVVGFIYLLLNYIRLRFISRKLQGTNCKVTSQGYGKG